MLSLGATTVRKCCFLATVSRDAALSGHKSVGLAALAGKGHVKARDKHLCPHPFGAIGYRAGWRYSAGVANM